jgi:hypothetical protein
MTVEAAVPAVRNEFSKSAGDRLRDASAWQARLPPQLLPQRNRLGCGYDVGKARVTAQRIFPYLGIPDNLFRLVRIFSLAGRSRTDL